MRSFTDIQPGQSTLRHRLEVLNFMRRVKANKSKKERKKNKISREGHSKQEQKTGDLGSEYSSWGLALVLFVLVRNIGSFLEG